MFAGWLRLARQRAGRTQEELATAVGYSLSTIRRWESGTSQIPTNALRPIATFLGVELPSNFAEWPAESHAAAAESPSAAALQASSRRLQFRTHAVTDAPSEFRDLLGFADYANALVDFILNEHTGKPLTIAIDGAWGTGKTSLMRMMSDRLQAHSAATRDGTGPVVWFNAWKYDREQILWPTLPTDILLQIRRQYTLRKRASSLAKRLWTTLKLNGDARNRAFRFGTILVMLAAWVAGGVLLLALASNLGDIARSIIALFTAVGIISFIRAAINPIRTAYSKRRKAFQPHIGRYATQRDPSIRLSYLSEFEVQLRTAIDIVTGSGNVSLVVFIDNLDRCAPPKLVEIIEQLVCSSLPTTMCLLYWNRFIHNRC